MSNTCDFDADDLVVNVVKEFRLFCNESVDR